MASETFKTICVAVVLIQCLRIIIKNVYNYFVGPYLKVGPNLQDQGKWAVITGATDGLGRAYAEGLAKKNINIILISRSMEKLEKVAKEIEQKYNVETRTIQADFTKSTEIYEHIEKQLLNYEIGILVNNVGLSYPYPEYFLQIEKNDPQFHTDMINCNIFSVTNMCKIVLPGMIERKKGVIINVSSLSSQIHSPMLSVYAASKAYIDKFSSNLLTEYGKHGIVVQSVIPGFVATKMSKIRKSTWMAPTPEFYVKHALTTIGIENTTTGYYPHKIMFTFTRAFECIADKYARLFTTRIMENVRERAIKKKTK